MIDFKALFKDYEFPFTVEKGENGWYALGLPFLYTDNDGIEIYVIKHPDGTIRLTDDGWTLGVHSCFNKQNIDVVKRIVGFSDYCRYDEKKNEIGAEATEECFAVALLEMVSVIIASNYAVTALWGMKVTKNADQDSENKE